MHQRTFGQLTTSEVKMDEKFSAHQQDDQAITARLVCRDERAIRELLTLYSGRVRGYLASQHGNVLRRPEIDQVVNDAAFNA